jgi:pentatricopeptide repeat protein
LTTEPMGGSASDIWRETVGRAVDEARPEPWKPDEEWIEEPEAEPAPKAPALGRAAGPVQRDLATGRDGASSPGGRRRTVPRPVVDEITARAGSDRAARLSHRVADAAYAYEKERYQEARRALRALADEVPDSPAVRELYGLVLYRSGQWAAAARQLEVFHDLTGSFDQHPVLADCYRALGRFDDAERLWDELREASPGADLVAEGRIVAAGCRADREDLPGAIAVLERSARRVQHPQDRHLRQWYALGDLYERAGDIPRARELFARVAACDPDAFDVRSRLRSLR